MSEAEESEPADPETTTVNIRVTEQFLRDIDAAWKEEGYTSRSGFLRHAIRDAVEHPGLSRGSWKGIAAEEYAMRTGEGESYSREVILDLIDGE
jgi:Arc/MetJ-type ribon-helix-helix transcriptional regulator